MTVSKIAQTSLYPGASQAMSQVSGKTQTNDFSQIFAAQSGEENSKDYTKTEATENNKLKESPKSEDAAVEKNTDNVETVEKKTEVSETEKTETTNKAESMDAEEVDTEEIDVEMMENVISEIMTAMQQVLGVTEEELKAALEELGIAEEELLNTDVIPKIVVALTEGADELSIMTNEELFSNVQELTAKVEEVLGKFSEQLDMKSLKNISNENITDRLETEEVRVDIAVEENKILIKTDGNVQSDNERSDNEQNDSESANQQVTYAQTVSERIEQAVAKVETNYSQTTTESIMNQIQDVIKVIQKENLTEMELQLHPASLGNVRVALAAKEGVITATFTAENEAVKAALESQMVVLKQNFEEQGIKVEAVEVTVASHAFERNLSGEGNGNTNDEASPNKKKSARRISLSDLDNEIMEEELSEEDRIVAEMMKQNGNTVDYTV